MKFRIMEYKHEKGNAGHSPYNEMGNMGPQKLPNFGIEEEGKYGIGNVE